MSADFSNSRGLSSKRGGNEIAELFRRELIALDVRDQRAGAADDDGMQ